LPCKCVRQISKNQATGKTVAEHYGKIDISSLKIIGPEQAMFEEFAVRALFLLVSCTSVVRLALAIVQLTAVEQIQDIRDGPNPAMSMDGLSKALHEMHVDKSGDDLMTAFKMTDLNGDGKVRRFLYPCQLSPAHAARENVSRCALFGHLLSHMQIDLDEFLFAVKIRHGDGFEKVL
jgi:hypothetical protein